MRTQRGAQSFNLYLYTMQKFRFTHPALNDSETDEEQVFWLSGKMEVCPECGGTGSHVRRDIDDSAMVDSMREDGDDEGLEAYFGGAYDVRCTRCNGANVVFAPNMEELGEANLKAISDWHQAEWEYQRECAAERRMGA